MSEDKGEVPDALVEHVRVALIRAFGSGDFDVWLGKDGLAHHSARAIAEVAVSALAPLLNDERVAATARALITNEKLARPLEQPDTW